MDLGASWLYYNREKSGTSFEGHTKCIQSSLNENTWHTFMILDLPEAKGLKKAPEGLGKDLVTLPDPKPAPEVVGSQVGHHGSSISERCILSF